MKKCKKIVPVVLALTVPFASSVFAGESVYRVGDVNQDGLVNTGDATKLLQYCVDSFDISRNEGMYKELMNVNGDEVVNTGDVTYLLRKLAERSSEQILDAGYAFQRVYRPISDEKGDETWMADSWYQQYRENKHSNDLICVIRSVEELEEFFAPTKTRLYSDGFIVSGSSDTLDLLEKYDSSFFEENCLIFAHVWDSSMAYDLDVPQITVENGCMTVDVDLVHHMISESLESEYIMAIETPKVSDNTDIKLDVKTRIETSK